MIDSWVSPRPGDPKRPPSSEACAASKAREASAECPSVAQELTSLASELSNRRRTAAGLGVTTSDDAKWLLQTTEDSDARLFRLTENGPTLSRKLLAPASWKFGPLDRLFGQSSSGKDALFVLDPETGATTTIEDVKSWSASGELVILVGAGSIRRLDVRTLAVTGTITFTLSDHPFVDGSSAELLGRGDSVMAGDVLGSFSSGKVLAGGLTFGARTGSQSLVVACSDTGEEIRVLDVATGAVVRRVPTKGGILCGVSRPTLSPDESAVFAVDMVPDRQGMQVAELVVIDVKTGRETRTMQPNVVFGTALNVFAYVRAGKSPRLCVSFGNMHWHRDECPWSIESGHIVRSTRDFTQELAHVSGLVGAELSRATSPDGSLFVVATCDPPRPKSAASSPSNLRLALANVTTKRVRKTIPVLAGPFFSQFSDYEGDGPPGLRFVSPSQVFVHSRTAPPFNSRVVDLEAGTVVILEGDVEPLAGQYGVLHTTLHDLARHRSWSLDPTPEAWDAAPQLEDACVGWP